MHFLVGKGGLTYLWQARNFTVGNKLPPEDCLTNCHWQFSPHELEAHKILFASAAQPFMETTGRLAQQPPLATVVFNKWCRRSDLNRHGVASTGF